MECVVEQSGLFSSLGDAHPLWSVTVNAYQNRPSAASHGHEDWSSSDEEGIEDVSQRAQNEKPANPLVSEWHPHIFLTLLQSLLSQEAQDRGNVRSMPITQRTAGASPAASSFCS